MSWTSWSWVDWGGGGFHDEITWKTHTITTKGSIKHLKKEGIYTFTWRLKENTEPTRTEIQSSQGRKTKHGEPPK